MDLSRRQLLQAVGAAALGSRPEDQVGWAVLGLGGYAQGQMLPAFARCKRSRLVGLVSGTPDKAARVAAQYRIEAKDVVRYEDIPKLREDPRIQVVYVVTPPGTHRRFVEAAAAAGKHVFCEKPMAHSSAACGEMEAAANAANRQLMIGHCLRYWPEYVAAQAIIASGAYGGATYARLHRSGGTPKWSHEDWLRIARRSGGVVLDMHVHDVDAALWWFGQPEQIDADGTFWRDLPTGVDAGWRYANGLRVQLHSYWDDNDTPFRYAFTVVMERGTLAYDSAHAAPALRLYTHDGATVVEVEKASAYQSELNDFYAHLRRGEAATRVTLTGSRAAVETVEEESRQIYAKNKRTKAGEADA